MSIEQIVILALLQGITEFLPISSSGHLILLPILTGWKDQGLITDVMVHMGSFVAVLVYFWRDVLDLFRGALDFVRRIESENARKALFIVLATIPAVIFGLFVKLTGIIDAQIDTAQRQQPPGGGGRAHGLGRDLRPHLRHAVGAPHRDAGVERALDEFARTGPTAEQHDFARGEGRLDPRLPKQVA